MGLVAGTREDAILGEKLEAGDLVEYFGYHEKESMGAVLGTVLDANYVKSGPWVRIDVIACESEYYSWWLNEKTNPGWYHLCAQKKQEICKATGAKDYEHIDYWRKVSLGDVLKVGISWAKRGPARKRITTYLAKLSKDLGDEVRPNGELLVAGGSKDRAVPKRDGGAPQLFDEDADDSGSEGGAKRAKAQHPSTKSDSLPGDARRRAELQAALAKLRDEVTGPKKKVTLSNETVPKADKVERDQRKEKSRPPVPMFSLEPSRKRKEKSPESFDEKFQHAQPDEDENAKDGSRKFKN